MAGKSTEIKRLAAGFKHIYYGRLNPDGSITELGELPNASIAEAKEGSAIILSPENGFLRNLVSAFLLEPEGAYIEVVQPSNAPSLGGQRRDNSPMLGGDRRVETSHIPKCIRCGALYRLNGNGTVTAKCDCRAGARYEVDPSVL